MKLAALAFFTVLICWPAESYGQSMNSKAVTTLKIHHLKQDFAVSELDTSSWTKGQEVTVERYWSGITAPVGRRFKARLLWSETAIYVRFEAAQNELLIVSDTPELKTKTKGLWDRDVCEIFFAPNKAERNKYFEFEIAPTGEWIDLGIYVTPTKRETDFDYNSGMESAVRIDKSKVVMAIKIPWKAFGRTPKTGDVWLGNLFRCVGKDPTRGYLSWQATKTKEPNFHVPEKFGEFEFTR